MIGTRLAVVVALIGIGMALPVEARGDGGLFTRRPRLDPGRVRQLVETLRSDPDEKKQKAAIKELSEADPRANPEVIPALMAALRKDAATVRASAAEAIGRLKTVFPLAGAALEKVAEADPVKTVRDAARQSLWEYHLNGYRSTKGADGLPTQTAEPPIAKAAPPRPPVTIEPPTARVVTSSATLPPVMAVRPPAVVPLPPLGPPPGPRIDLMPRFFGTRPFLLGSSHPNLTVEPPIAKAPTDWIPPPTISPEPPILPRFPDPVVIRNVPPIAHDLPPIVTPPDE